ncbi:phosphotransferase enzyme family protein [Thermoflavimicrobium dichotomicum]|uniref:Ser/Thr protein kinase RdoA involved in Cpx stress response, MazF antagonist n=1 Tax=Thermoflavimicrobium dichotomicum TaxID=46223 RepID=A0A1I3TT39_9BACL|nr:phosphotransferase [Thermoflavimicrobium dichotomicum]SFJ72761.1 Ser/Thr protein kinase RdoA involved in Cpx stress response, MazF antagonist [Thermoflavimicrobium dichotomicum]
MWSQDILQEACERFDGDPASLKILGGFYKNVYEYKRNGQTYVLKLIPLAMRDEGLLYMELEWVEFLRKHGLFIPQTVLSKKGQQVEIIHKLPFPCCVISFEKAKGKKIDPYCPTEWNDQLFRRWGQVMGKMHALSFKFFRSQTDSPVEHWNEGEIYHHDLSLIDKSILKRWEAYLEIISTFPKSEQTYGLIHNDLTHENFLIDNDGNLQLIDFSDCKHHFFTYDIAISLYHACMTVDPAERSLFKEIFLKAFADGYLTENELQSDWKEYVDFFIEFRSIFSYLYWSLSQHQSHLPPSQIAYLKELEDKLKRGRPALS